VQELVAFWREGGLSHVLVTGGEPLLQADSVLLMQSLLDAGATVHLETNGSLTAREVPAAVRKVLDVKVPSSAPGLPPSFLLENYRYLQPWDQLKFVVSSREDYLWGLAFLLAHPAPLDPAHILFSPAGGQLEPVVLAEWMVQDRLAYRFSLQIHKVLWGNERGR
jgi:7-carboxy-7-deazaguanine synthase